MVVDILDHIPVVPNPGCTILDRVVDTDLDTSHTLEYPLHFGDAIWMAKQSLDMTQPKQHWSDTALERGKTTTVSPQVSFEILEMGEDNDISDPF